MNVSVSNNQLFLLQLRETSSRTHKGNVDTAADGRGDDVGITDWVELGGNTSWPHVSQLSLLQENDEKPEDCIPAEPGNEDARTFLASAPTRGLWMPLGKEVKVMQCEYRDQHWVQIWPLLNASDHSDHFVNVVLNACGHILFTNVSWATYEGSPTQLKSSHSLSLARSNTRIHTNLVIRHIARLYKNNILCSVRVSPELHFSKTLVTFHTAVEVRSGWQSEAHLSMEQISQDPELFCPLNLGVVLYLQEINNSRP